MQPGWEGLHPFPREEKHSYENHPNTAAKTYWHSISGQRGGYVPDWSEMLPRAAGVCGAVLALLPRLALVP